VDSGTPDDRESLVSAVEKETTGEAAEFPRTVLVSNRLPVSVVHAAGGYEIKPSSGGLATALGPMHEAGSGLWLGWPGATPGSAAEKSRLFRRLRAKRLVPVTLPDELQQDYYLGFSNSVLWPLLHYRPHLAQLEERWWRAYERANRLFARGVGRVARPDDAIWVHDYHLMLLPGLLRARFPEARIAFFLHTPFPSSEIFRILPWRRELMLGLMGADLIGFHTYDYLRHFRTTVQRVLGVDAVTDRISADGREVRLGVFPVGIDVDRYWRGATEDAEGLAELAQLREDSHGRRLILGVDRMDYTKGIAERLLALERFFERFPAFHGGVEFLQIGVPSRADVRQYQHLRRTVEEIVGRINGRFGTPDWTPVKYLYRGVTFARLCALYRHASVLLVTPLRDGMNLVAKEYVAAQRGSDGVLVLSEFAGAAAELPEALLVNPYDPESIAGALQRALTLSKRDRQRRMASLVQRVWRGDVSRWARRVMQALVAAGNIRSVHPPRIEGEALERLRAEWRTAAGRMLLLDYDGTLRTFVPRPEDARPDRALLRLLGRLSRLSAVEVVVISGRDRATLGRWLGDLSLTLVAEHGRWLRTVDGRWRDIIGGRRLTWFGPVKELLEEISALTPGSFVEQKSAALAWHFRTSNHELAELRLRELEERLHQLHSRWGFDVLHGDRVLEVRAAGVSKANVLVPLLAGKPPTDFILGFGDDQTDEEMFEQFPAGAWSIHVGSRPSAARFSLPGPVEVRQLLGMLAETLEAGTR
jgi:trehalose 6-phosphate synthase/phosphatase